MGTDGAVRGKLYLYKFSRVVTEVDKVKLKRKNNNYGII